jgi:hypothetical protein
MNTNEIKDLVEKFYTGDTTLDEENFLYNYFNGEEIADELLAEKECFAAYNELHPVDIPADYSNKIDNLFEKFEDEAGRKYNLKHVWLWVGSVAAIIAIMFFIGYNENGESSTEKHIAMSDTSTFGNKTVYPILTDTTMVDVFDTVNNIIESKEVAENIKEVGKKGKKQPEKISMEDYMKMKEALELVSSGLNRGLGQLSIVSENISQSIEILEDKNKN